jgi:EAL domain-containing protein (putative c-di-GMP-specific phosphodiesterase class I)
MSLSPEKLVKTVSKNNQRILDVSQIKVQNVILEIMEGELQHVTEFVMSV